MSVFTEAYAQLLIKQYWDKANANAEIQLKASSWEKINNIISIFSSEFDIDLAYGDRLDKIGKIVGAPRAIPFAIAKIAFGFSENPNSRGFNDKFVTVTNKAPFANKFEPSKTLLQLNDADYRTFLKAKIMINIASALMVSDEKITLQDAVNVAFEGQAFVLDKKDMSLDYYVSVGFDPVRLNAFRELDLLPHPMGVDINLFSYDPAGTFAFADDPLAVGFADKFDPSEIGGIFSEKVV